MYNYIQLFLEISIEQKIPAVIKIGLQTFDMHNYVLINTNLYKSRSNYGMDGITAFINSRQLNSCLKLLR